MFKWPNQGTSPSKGELVCVRQCVCVCLGREAGRVEVGCSGWGGLHIDRLSPSSPAIINLPTPLSPLLPLHPLRDPSCCTHQQLIQALTKQHHAYSHTLTHTFYNCAPRSAWYVHFYRDTNFKIIRTF